MFYNSVSHQTSLIEFSEGINNPLAKADMVDRIYLTFQKALSQRSERNFTLWNMNEGSLLD